VVRGSIMLTTLAPPFATGSVLVSVAIGLVSVSSELYLSFLRLFTFGFFTLEI